MSLDVTVPVQYLDLANSTVRSILNNKDKIKECGKTAAPLRASELNGTLDLYRCTVHLDIKLIYSPTDALIY